MKKLSIYLMLAIAGLFMASCGPEDNEFAGLTTVTPEEGIIIPGFEAVPTGAIDLADYGDDALVQVFELDGEALPEGYSIENIRIYIHPEDDEANVTKFEAPEGYFTKGELQDYVTSIYGKRPEARVFIGHVFASVVDANGTGALVDAGTVLIEVTPEAPFIAETYYLIGGPMDWQASAVERAQPFSHSDLDVYDDPVFTYMLTAEGETWFAIGDELSCASIENGDWSQLFGTTSGNGNNGMEGTFERRTALSDDGSFMLPAGTYLISINMMDYTYTISSVASRFYMVGAIPGWNADAARTALFTPEGDGQFAYTAYFYDGNNLKIWGEEDLGNWDTAYGAVEDNSTAENGALVNIGAGAIMVPHTGLWTLHINISDMSYTWEFLGSDDPDHYTSLGLIGSFNGWGSQDPMTEVTPHNWYGRIWVGEIMNAPARVIAKVESANIQEVKFRANDDWGYNWGYGGSTGDWTVSESDWNKTLSKDGGNICVDGNYYYDIYLNDYTGEASIIKANTDR